MSSSFSPPAPPASGVQWEELKDALLLFDVKSQEHGVKTTYGDKDPVRVDLVVIDHTDAAKAGETFPDALVFGTVLVSQLNQSLGQKVLGRLTTGNAKPGQKPPWLLNEASADDIAKAEAWVSENQAPAVQSAQAPF